MSPEVIIAIQSSITKLQEGYDELKSLIAAAGIDAKLHLRANEPIAPGTGCKVAWDANGLILGSEPLAPADIPNIGVSKVTGLDELLQSLASKNELKKLAVSRKDFFAFGSVRGTATKVNYDDTGRIVSSADLLPEDIPVLPIDHIEGLQATLDMIKKSMPVTVEARSDIQSSPGTYTKLTINERGQVVGGDNLTTEDLPSDFVSRMKAVERMLPTLATIISVNELTEMMSTKVEALPTPVKPGTYTKVVVNSSGQVTKGDQLSREDLPRLNVTDILGMDRVLNDKADRSELTEMRNIVASLVSAADKVPEISKINSSLAKKAEASDVRTLREEISKVTSKVDQLLNGVSMDQLLQQLNTIVSDLSTISGRIGILEQKISEDHKNEDFPQE